MESPEFAIYFFNNLGDGTFTQPASFSLAFAFAPDIAQVSPRAFNVREQLFHDLGILLSNVVILVNIFS